MFINQNKLSLMMLSMHSDRNLFRPKVQGMDILGYWKSQELFQRVYCKKHLQKRASIMKTRAHHEQEQCTFDSMCLCARVMRQHWELNNQLFVIFQWLIISAICTWFFKWLIGCSKKNCKRKLSIPRKCFWTTEKETRIKI